MGSLTLRWLILLTLMTLCLTVGSFECPDMFHCPGAYCVPYNRVCDGVIDCPYGDDENHACANYTCPGINK